MVGRYFLAIIINILFLAVSSLPALAKPGMPTVEFVASLASGSEEVGTAYIPVKLSRPATKTVTVNYAVRNGTALNGLDYLLDGGIVTFKPGETVKSIPVKIINDEISENDETIAITLEDSKNAYLNGTLLHTYTIIDDDSYPAVGFSNNAASGAESLVAPNIEITLSRVSTKPVSVNYAVTGGTASPADYELIPGTLTFAPGETSKFISFSIIDDKELDGDKTVQIALFDPVNAYLSSENIHTYTILDDDPAIVFACAASSLDEDGGDIKVAAKLTAASDKVVRVDYAATGGTASNGSDYQMTAGTLTFQPGETTKEITVAVINDETVEDDETIILTLANPSNGHLGDNFTHAITIRNDDTIVEYKDSFSSVTENPGTPLIEVKLSHPVQKTVTIEYAVGGGTASAIPGGTGQDYELASGILTFAPGETSKTIPLTVIADGINELDETVEIVLLNAKGASLGGKKNPQIDNTRF